MSQAQLNHIMSLDVYKEITDKIELGKVADDFVSGQERILHFFG